DVIREMRQKFGGIAGLQAFPTEVPAIGGQRSEPLQFAVRGQSLEQVGQYATLLNEELGKIEGLGRINFNLQLEMPQLQLHVDRVRARSLGLSTRDVALAANVLAGGVDIARYNDDPGDGERYDIRLKGAEGVFRSPSDLSKIYLRSDAGELVRLDTVARFEEILGPARIDRLNLQYAALSYADPEIPLGEAMAIVEQKAHELMPLGLTIEFLGSAREFERTLAGLIFVFVTSVILLYMVLASQFDSFIQPLIIMAALPLAMTGGLGGLYLVGHTLNIYSMIGLILLIGLVAKNSILLVDLTNQRREQGMNIREALLDACPIRMRPVLMTSLTVILAMLPAAIGIEAGSGRNGPLAVAVISGMISSTLLTLVVIPVAYSLVENGLLRLQKRRAARHDATKTPQASA
ncbi:MAG: efflux RND transporter permease subunit, partial [Pseudomonadota bacterium]|nr:efflux RND transporter permease subunit [Pseudomonadota bacterium]